MIIIQNRTCNTGTLRVKHRFCNGEHKFSRAVFWCQAYDISLEFLKGKRFFNFGWTTIPYFIYTTKKGCFYSISNRSDSTGYKFSLISE